MKKLLLICLLFFATASWAQQREVRAFEVELGAGTTFGANRLRGVGFGKCGWGETAFVEARYNFKRLPIDLGFQLRGTIFGRKDYLGGWLNFSSVNYMLTSDYNFRRNTNCTLFAGVGVGMVSIDGSAQTEIIDLGGYTDNGPSGSACVMPRVGVELFHRLRLTFSYLMEERAHRQFHLTVGVAIGGGKK